MLKQNRNDAPGVSLPECIFTSIKLVNSYVPKRRAPKCQICGRFMHRIGMDIRSAETDELLFRSPNKLTYGCDSSNDHDFKLEFDYAIFLYDGTEIPHDPELNELEICKACGHRKFKSCHPQ